MGNGSVSEQSVLHDAAVPAALQQNPAMQRMSHDFVGGMTSRHTGVRVGRTVIRYVIRNSDCPKNADDCYDQNLRLDYSGCFADS